MLNLSNCKRLQEIPNDFVCLSSLRNLNLSNCERLQSLPELPSQVMRMLLDNCKSLETLVSSSFISASTGSCIKEYTFMYSVCLKLDESSRCNIMSDSQMRITEIAVANGEHHSHCSFTAVLPGSEIPGWFSYQSQGSSIDIQFPPFCFSTSFLGFAFSVVLEPHFLSFRCNGHFRNATGDICFSFQPGGRYSSSNTKSDHVFIFYEKDTDFSDLNDWLIENSCNANEALFEFKPRFYSDSNSSVLKVKKCAVHLIYAEDRQEAHNSSNVQSEQSLQPDFLDQVIEINTNNKRSRENDFFHDQTSIIADGVLVTMKRNCTLNN